MDDPCNDLGGGVPPICIKVKDPMCGILRAIQVVSIKNARFKYQPSTPNASLCIKKKHTFLWKLVTKGERLYKDMKALGKIETKK